MGTSAWRDAVRLILLLGSVKLSYGESLNNLLPVQSGNTNISEEFLGLDILSNPGISSFGIPAIGDKILKRDSCPIGTLSCGDGVWCHPVGTQCCPTDHSKTCATGETCCIAEGGCADSGYFCCSGSRRQCRTGSTCCSNGGCAPSGGTCCGDTVCDSDEKCCTDHCAPKSAECCGSGYCASGKECCGDGLGCANEGFYCCNGMRQACKKGSKCCVDYDGVPYCAPECLPTLKFPHYPGVTDDIAENMCKELKAYFKKNGHVEFKWNGGGSGGAATTSGKRRASGCGGPTSGGLSCLPGFNCEEFPMASTEQGGKGASILCVPGDINLYYGTLWNIFLRNHRSSHGFTKGSKFRITLDGCDFTTSSLTRREKRQSSNFILNQHDNVTVFDGSLIKNLTGGSNLVTIPITPNIANPGTYTFNYTLTSGETLNSGHIINVDGYEYVTLDALKSGSSNSTSFQLEELDDSPVFFLGLTEAKDVKLNYTVSAPPPSSTTLASSTSTFSQPTQSTDSGDGKRLRISRYSIVIPILGTLLM